MVITFPCNIYVKATGDKKDFIYCDKCNLLVHVKCNNLNDQVINILAGMVTLGFVSNVTVSYTHMVLYATHT